MNLKANFVRGQEQRIADKRFELYSDSSDGEDFRDGGEKSGSESSSEEGEPLPATPPPSKPFSGFVLAIFFNSYSVNFISLARSAKV